MIRLRNIISVAVAGIVVVACSQAALATQKVKEAVSASYAAVHVGGNGLPRTIGSAVAFDDTHVLTNAHVLKAGGAPVAEAVLVRQDGERAPVRVLVRSERMDLAILVAPKGFLRPAERLSAGLREGMPVWAAGSNAQGAVSADGWLTRLGMHIPAFGPGMVARMDAALGFSGGPVLDGEGRVVGITTAVRDAGPAAVAGPAGLPDGARSEARRPRREVFLLEIAAVEAEARRLLGL